MAEDSWPGEKRRRMIKTETEEEILCVELLVM